VKAKGIPNCEQWGPEKGEKRDEKNSLSKHIRAERTQSVEKRGYRSNGKKRTSPVIGGKKKRQKRLGG